jgi:hypothetical protein
MNYKMVPVSNSVSIPVPDNLTPDEEALYIARRVAFVNLEELEADYRKTLELWENGKLIPMADVLDELAKDPGQNKG